MVSSLRFREILLFSLVGSSVSDRIHLTARQGSQGGGSLGAIPLCVASAEGTLFTETSGVLPTAGCPSAPGAATEAAGGAQPTLSISVPPAPAGVSSTSISPAPAGGVGASLSSSPAAISSTGSPQGSVAAALLPSFITIPSATSGSSETFSQTVFLRTVTTGIVASGGTTTVQVLIVVDPGGIGFIGQTGALPTGVSIDGNGNTPGGSNNNNNPGGGNNNPGGENNNNGNDGDDNDDNLSTQSTQQESTASSSASASASASSTEACILTEAGVTSQVGSASASGSASPSASPAATTSSPSASPPAATTAAPAPSQTAAGPVLCSNWELGLNGVQVGTDCDGDPNKTVTVTVAPGKRAIKTIF